MDTAQRQLRYPLATGAQPCRPLSAIVIDANAHEREITLALCRRLGIAVGGWADRGAAALELIESLPAPPDLVIADLHLPDMDGADLLQALSMLECDFSIAICSAVGARLQDAALVLAGALGMTPLAALPKPLRLDALRSATAACVPTLRRLALQVAHVDAPVAPPQPDELAAALEQQQFELHYQPKTALRDRSLHSAEALVRWRHPRHGLITPAGFLPQIEAAGLVGPLTMEVLRLALRDWRHWHAAGLSLPLSVNLSPLSLTDPQLASQLIGAVAAADVPPFAITFEIIEHAEISDLATALRTLIKLRLHGFGLSLDDYGAGHASMLQLSRFPFTELKLDRQLVHRASQRPHLQSLLRNTIATTRELGIVSVAEGIETEQDLELLRQLGCDLGQGYLIAHPMSAAALLSWRDSRPA